MLLKKSFSDNFQCLIRTIVTCSKVESNVSSVKPESIHLKPNYSVPLGETPLTDSFGRFHSYLRISLTEKCNLRCQYCMPLEGVPLTPKDELLTSDEISRITQIFANLGVDKVRLTGGEPTMRKDLAEIIRGITSIKGIKQVGMTSNGVALAGKLEKLVESGLSKLNISIDTLIEPKYEILARRPGFKQAWKAIDKAEAMFDMLKLNCVVMRGINLDEVTDFVKLTEKRRLDIRFIEFMPFGGNHFAMNKFVPYREMLKLIQKDFPEIQRLEDQPNDTSKAYKIPGFAGQFGFITSMSEHFCGTCNRLRITADGNLKVCLHGNSEVSLRDSLRNGYNDQQLENIIAQAVYKKKKQHAGIKQLMNVSNRPMILIGSAIESFKKPLFFKNHLLFSVVNYSSLTHVDSSGKASMVDVSSKQISVRIALAQAQIKVSKEIMAALVNNSLKKGDVLAVARIAGIQAAKKTSDLIPLCHQIPLSDIQIKFHLNESDNVIVVFCRVKTNYSTGIEMEALIASSAACLTIYDMCKAISHDMEISNVKLLGKSGGKRNVGKTDFDSNLELK
uniref:Radical SAM core domain-containing protein n=1 Tax=Panagrolaimus sp. JU765 TaxID=591449 RepID=A0AC34QSS8_9BILA